MKKKNVSPVNKLQSKFQRRQVEENLRESEASLKKSQAVAHVGHWSWDTQTDRVTWSDEMHRIFGIDPQAFSGNLNEVIAKAIHPDDREKVVRANEAVVDEQIPAPLEYRVVWPDQSVHTVLAIPGERFTDEKGSILRLTGIVQDITERKQAEGILRNIIDKNPIAIQIVDKQGFTLKVNSAHTRLFGSVPPANYSIFNSFQKISPVFSELLERVKKGEVVHFPDIYTNAHDVAAEVPDIPVWVRATGFALDDGNGIPEQFVFMSENITERRLAEETLQASERNLKLFVDYAPAAIAMFDRNMKYIAASRRYLVDYRLGDQDIVGHSHYEIFPEIPERWKEIHSRCLAGSIERAEEDPFPRADGTLDWVRWEIHPWYEKPGEIGGIILFSEVITERKRAEETLIESEEKYRFLFENNPHSMWVYDLKTLAFLAVNESAIQKYGYTREEFLRMTIVDIRPAEDISRLKTFVAQPRMPLSRSGEWRHRLKNGNIIDVDITSHTLRMGGNDSVLVVAQDITERKQAEKKVALQLQRMSALSEIDRAINSGVDMRLSLDVLVNDVIAQLGVDAASVMLLDASSHTLDYVAGKGFRSAAIRESSLRLGDGLAGQAGMERKVLHVPNLAQAGNNFKRAKLLKGEEFVEYFGVPLIAKGILKGVLEIFNRTPLVTDNDWLNYLETLGGQAAIAIDNAQLFEGIQQSNFELVTAYNATITGWSHAMDLRDKETEGHTQRVTELTVKLAGKMGVSQHDLIQVRRGALLHDIGKLGVPDHILLKPGKLTDEEWVIMRQHPVNAYEMLLPITYLRHALDIPYCHHEKWDGSGYPRGLKGDQIPMAARIFAIVDVWDALLSDRPYRAGWPVEKIRKYLIEQSGKHFEPRVLEAFLSLLAEAPDIR